MKTPSLQEVMPEVKRINGKNRVRTLDEADVTAALALRAKSTAKVVRLWGGFVANCYRGKAVATRLDLYADGAFEVRAMGCNRSHGKGELLLESNDEGKREVARIVTTAL